MNLSSRTSPYRIPRHSDASQDEDFYRLQLILDPSLPPAPARMSRANSAESQPAEARMVEHLQLGACCTYVPSSIITKIVFGSFGANFYLRVNGVGLFCMIALSYTSTIIYARDCANKHHI